MTVAASLKSGLAILWTLPNTLAGILIGGVGLCFGGRVQVRRGVIEFFDGGVKWFLHRLPAGQFTLALTLGHTILGQTSAALDVSRSHEHVHVRQYERWGPFMLPAYFLASLHAWLCGKHFYRDNPFEIEAYAADEGDGSHSE